MKKSQNKKYHKNRKSSISKEIDKLENIKKFGKEHLISQNRIVSNIKKTRMMHELNKIKKPGISSTVHSNPTALESLHSIKNTIDDYEKILGTHLRENTKQRIMKKYNDAKKQELRLKLFQILGTRICSKCNSKDMAKLGFYNIYDKSFMTIPQLNWDKYVDDHESSKKNLQVFCLICNPTQKSESKIKKLKIPKKKDNFRTFRNWSQG